MTFWQTYWADFFFNDNAWLIELVVEFPYSFINPVVSLLSKCCVKLLHEKSRMVKVKTKLQISTVRDEK